MGNSRTNQLLIGSTILSSVLSITIIALTIYHHLTIQDNMDELKKA